MKLKLATIAFVATMGIASSASAQDGQINFTGKITETGCKINGGVTSAQDVKLGEVSKTALPAAGDTAATTRFSLVLTECRKTCWVSRLALNMTVLRIASIPIIYS